MLLGLLLLFLSFSPPWPPSHVFTVLPSACWLGAAALRGTCGGLVHKKSMCSSPPRRTPGIASESAQQQDQKQEIAGRFRICTNVECLWSISAESSGRWKPSHTATSALQLHPLSSSFPASIQQKYINSLFFSASTATIVWRTGVI